MPNEIAAHRKWVSFVIDRELYFLLVQKCKRENMPITTALANMVRGYVSDEMLSAENREKMMADINSVMKKRVFNKQVTEQYRVARKERLAKAAEKAEKTAKSSKSAKRRNADTPATVPKKRGRKSAS